MVRRQCKKGDFGRTRQSVPDHAGQSGFETRGNGSLNLIALTASDPSDGTIRSNPTVIGERWSRSWGSLHGLAYGACHLVLI